MAGEVNLYDTYTLLPAIDRIQEVPTLLGDEVFSRTETSDTEFIQKDKVIESERLADANDLNAEARPVERQNYDTDTFVTPYFSHKMATDSQDMLRRQMGVDPYRPNSSPVDLATQKLGQDLAVMLRMINRREEAMRCEGILTGKVTLTLPKGGTQEVDYNAPADHFIASGALDATWDDANADILEDIEIGKQKVEEDSIYTPRLAIMGVNIAKYFLKNNDIKAKLDNRRYLMGEINPRRFGPGVRYLGNIEEVDFWVYSRTYVDQAGSRQHYWDPKKFALISPEAQAVMHYGALKNPVFGGLMEGKYLPSSWQENDPAVRMIKVEARPLPVHYEPEANYIIEALAP